MSEDTNIDSGSVATDSNSADSDSNIETSETSSADDSLSKLEALEAQLKEAQDEATKYKRMAEQRAKKAKSTESQPTDNDLVAKSYLLAAGIKAKDEVELALDTANKWNMSLDDLVEDADFQMKLEKHRTQKANLEATSGVRGDKSAGSGVDTPEYWIAKGAPPTAQQVPDRKARAKIARAFMQQSKSGKQFYND